MSTKTLAPSGGAPTGRHLGVEMLRIISTFMVIMLHTLGSYPILSIYTDNGVLLWLFEILSYGAVNIFAITSGYVSCKSKFKLSRLLNLWFQVFFIFIIMTVALGKISPADLDEHAYRDMFFPILGDLNWYFTAFFALSLFSPFLNIMIANLNQKQHKYLLTLIFVLFSVITCIPEVGDLFQTTSGYSFLWLACMYIIGAYIRNYGVPNPSKRPIWLMGYFACGLAAWAYMVIMADITTQLKGEAMYHRIFVSYTSPLILLEAICIFEFFVNLNFNFGRKFICWVSSLTFGIFVFHTQDLYWIFGLEKRVELIAQEGPLVSALGVIGIAATAFVLCGLATAVLMLGFKYLGINKLCDFLQNKVFRKINYMLYSEDNNVKAKK